MSIGFSYYMYLVQTVVNLGYMFSIDDRSSKIDIESCYNQIMGIEVQVIFAVVK